MKKDAKTFIKATLRIIKRQNQLIRQQTTRMDASPTHVFFAIDALAETNEKLIEDIEREIKEWL